MTEEEERKALSAEVGRMTTTFASLELHLHWLLWEMLGGESKAIRVVTERLGFGGQIDLLEALVKAGVPENKDRREKLRKLLPRLRRVGERRNSVVHAVVVDWGDEYALTRVRDVVRDDHQDALRPHRVSVSEVEKVGFESHLLAEQVSAVYQEMRADTRT